MYINQELNFSRVSKVREFTLYPTLIFPADKAPDRIGAVPTPLHSEGGGGVCCCSRSTSSCCRRRPCRSAALPLPLSLCLSPYASAADCLLWADLQWAEVQKYCIKGCVNLTLKLLHPQ